MDSAEAQRQREREDGKQKECGSRILVDFDCQSSTVWDSGPDRKIT